mmetsp:Transcript_60272/g.142000  ORF Transcript_60272/g.142000 Transcript_60272/m.142000 type:complete len:118 (-) Transcript_60272:87-440(-)|eukprot:3019659-Rhodomonas_salina.2
MSAVDGKPCAICGVTLEQECDMEWVWAPLYLGPGSLPFLIILAIINQVAFYISILLVFGIVVGFMVIGAMGSIQRCCNCMYKRMPLVPFFIMRKIWEWSACSKCKACDKMASGGREL